jgi:hypothetical protein
MGEFRGTHARLKAVYRFCLLWIFPAPEPVNFMYPRPLPGRNYWFPPPQPGSLRQTYHFVICTICNVIQFILPLALSGFMQRYCINYSLMVHYCYEIITGVF